MINRSKCSFGWNRLRLATWGQSDPCKFLLHLHFLNFFLFLPLLFKHFKSLFSLLVDWNFLVNLGFFLSVLHLCLFLYLHCQNAFYLRLLGDHFLHKCRVLAHRGFWREASADRLSRQGFLLLTELSIEVHLLLDFLLKLLLFVDFSFLLSIHLLLIELDFRHMLTHMNASIAILFLQSLLISLESFLECGTFQGVRVLQHAVVLGWLDVLAVE